MARDGAAAERAAAEAFAAGAAGLEEREAGEGVMLLVYATEAAMPAVREALAASGGDALALGAPEPVVEADWSEAWKAGLEAIVVSERLVVRPSFVAAPGGSAAELVIDPGQAFGTGGHASTRLALELIDAQAGRLAGARVLDTGCGSGVLALAALRLGAASAVGFDLDPLATAASAHNAAENGLAGRLQLFTGPLAALASKASFDLVLANMLSREFLPLVPGLAAHTARGGAAVFSGLLAGEHDRVEAALAAAGLSVADGRAETDANGDTWLALLTTC